MSYTLDIKQNAPVADRANTLLATVIAKLIERRNRQRAFRQTYAELAGLSDRDLSDLGISRSSIRAIAREAAMLDR